MNWRVRLRIGGVTVAQQNGAGATTVTLSLSGAGKLVEGGKVDVLINGDGDGVIYARSGTLTCRQDITEIRNI